jgi:aerobic carbon-monoxide dehydrogenase medium subunit
MRPTLLSFHRPKDIGEAMKLVRAGGVPLSGGQALIPAMRLRGAKPSRVVDLKLVSELSSAVEIVGASVRIGALATVASWIESDVVARHLPWLIEAGARLGDVQVRNRATIVGNICWADPRANFAVALLACDAVVHVQGAVPRMVALAELFGGYRLNKLAGEIVTAIDLPIQPAAALGQYVEFSRQQNDLAVVNVALNHCAGRWRLAVGGIARKPMRLTAVEDLLGRVDRRVEIGDVLGAIETTPINPLQDAFGSARYKKHLASVLIVRSWTELNARIADVAR